MDNRIIKVFENPEDYLIEEFINIFENLMSEKNRMNVALSGGTTPKLWLKKLSQYKMDWSNVHFFQVDERCVSANSKHNNAQMIKKNFIDKIDIREPNFHRINTDFDDIRQSAIDYYNDIASSFELSDEEMPEFDIIILGVGIDGHTASIFPNSQIDLDIRDIVQLTQSDQYQFNRITLSLKAINQAKNIFVLAKGKEKSEIIEKILMDQGQNLPAARLNPVNGKVFWLLDFGAAGTKNFFT